MKRQSTTFFTTLGKAQLENLTTIVNETLATGFARPAAKTFTAADLWNIQRHAKCRTQRRFL